jgi:hypothetical protein
LTLSNDGTLKPFTPKRRAGGGVVADLQRIGDVERPHILEIFDGEVVAREREELVCRRKPSDTGVQGGTVLGNGGWVIAVEDLALRPLRAP